MKKFLIALAALAAFSANAVVSGLPYEPFEANYPTYVLSDDSAANPQPFEANYPVQIEPMKLVKAYEPFEADYPTYVLKCSFVKPEPFEDCYPVQIK